MWPRRQLTRELTLTEGVLIGMQSLSLEKTVTGMHHISGVL